MALLLSRLLGPLFMSQWGATTGGNTTGNQFLNDAVSLGVPLTVETSTQKPASVHLLLWRLAGAYTAAGGQQSTMTARINGISQAGTATTVGAGAGTVITDLASGIAVTATDLLSVLFKFGSADASTMNPRAWLVGAVSASF